MSARSVLLVSMLTVVSSAHGTEYIHSVGDHTYTVRQASDCFEISDREAAECVSLFFEASEKELETSFDSIRGRLVRDRQLFEATQSKWASFKDSECDVRSVSAQAHRDPARQKWLMVRACAAELNEQRIKQLKALFLGCDSCLQ